MQRYLIEVEHEADLSSCLRVVEVFLKTGSHFLTNADWGCKDGEHKAWIIIDSEGEDEVLRIVPPEFRPAAKIVKLNKFTMEEIDVLRSHHVG
jgi:hypothetical protein